MYFGHCVSGQSESGRTTLIKKVVTLFVEWISIEKSWPNFNPSTHMYLSMQSQCVWQSVVAGCLCSGDQGGGALQVRSGGVQGGRGAD